MSLGASDFSFWVSWSEKLTKRAYVQSYARLGGSALLLRSAHFCARVSSSSAGSSLGKPAVEPLLTPRRQIGTGGLRGPEPNQRHEAPFQVWWRCAFQWLKRNPPPQPPNRSAHRTHPHATVRREAGQCRRRWLTEMRHGR